MGKATKISGEVHFTRRVSNTNKDIVMLIAYVSYKFKTYQIIQSNQEGIFLGKWGIDHDLALAELLKEALNYLKRDLNLKPLPTRPRKYKKNNKPNKK
jgi:predicted chitinase